MHVLDIIIVGCLLCPPEGEETFNSAEGVCSYPRKAKKKAPKEASSLVCVIRRRQDDSILMRKRPQSGLLAGLLEFPSFPLDSEVKIPSPAFVRQALKAVFGEKAVAKAQMESAGQVLHLFSHIRQTYHVWRVWIDMEEALEVDESSRWLKDEELDKEALPTAMKKVAASARKGGQKRKIEETLEPRTKGQKSIKAFLRTKN